MTESDKSGSEKPDTPAGAEPAKPAPASGLLPGMAVICLWMLALCGLGLIGVITHHLPPGVMVICVILAIAANGLLKLRRWGWALTLAATFLSLCYGTWMLIRMHQGPMIVMVVVNLIFFLYLIRPEVLERVK
ncbi:uncharacterized membrane protein (DUF2068 family) [Silvibacterium bohemicum]|uniref:Uncharacterized membrane protein (DUF2068 family) n=1 Tax=Silvibacterium bohemicum TaxID=1577686 RepID=A0A841K568_9BACT|nr:DUF2127 domain-containing protein [Silvibacterium bohemicum]MBB6146281.1 uncharacterized membrane protein (DUF2068 family) [Silvibacterium bohemicum]